MNSYFNYILLQWNPGLKKKYIFKSYSSSIFISLTSEKWYSCFLQEYLGQSNNDQSLMNITMAPGHHWGMARTSFL